MGRRRPIFEKPAPVNRIRRRKRRAFQGAEQNSKRATTKYEEPSRSVFNRIFAAAADSPTMRGVAETSIFASGGHRGPSTSSAPPPSFLQHFAQSAQRFERLPTPSGLLTQNRLCTSLPKCTSQSQDMHEQSGREIIVTGSLSLNELQCSLSE